MSNALALAAVTATLQSLLSRALLLDLPPALVTELSLGNAKVTALPLDRARPAQATINQLNLCLFQVVPAAALRNHSGAAGRAPLALELHYLVTAYSAGDDDRAAQVLLAQAMRALHERPVLSPDDLRLALRGNDLADALDHVRVSPRSVTLEDLARLFAMAQTQARLSAGYVASVILIDPAAPARAPLPVLRRGPDDRGVTLATSPHYPGPELQDLRLPQDRRFALPGDTVHVLGQQLRAPDLRVRLVHPRLAAPLELTPMSGSNPTDLILALPTDPAQLPAGIYTLSVLLRGPDGERSTGALALPVAPEIVGTPTLKRTGPDVAISFDLRPTLGPAQTATLIVGERELPIAPRDVPVTRLSVTVPGAKPGPVLLRLRVDGVDSDLLDRTASPPTAFNPNKRVTLP